MHAASPQAHTQAACPRCAAFSWGLILQDGDWVCSHCERILYRSLLAAFLATNRALAPATKRQAVFLRSLGLPASKDLTLREATDLIVRAQNARFYAWKVAQQAWGREMSGRELRPILNTVLSRPQVSAEIVRLIDQHTQAVMEALEAAGEGTPSASAAYAPNLPEDATFAWMRDELRRLYPVLKRAPATSTGSSAPAAPAAPAAPRQIQIAREKEVLIQISKEIQPQYFVGREPLGQSLRRRARLAAVPALLALAAYWYFSTPSSKETTETDRSISPSQNPPATPRERPKPVPAPSPAPQPAPVIQPPFRPEPEEEPPPVPQPARGGNEPAPEPELDRALQAGCEKAFRECKLPDGRTLREAFQAIQAAAAPKGYFFWEGQARPVRMGSAAQLFDLQWPVSWKSEGQNWTRLEPQWKVNLAAGTLTPSNADAQTFAKLKEELAR